MVERRELGMLADKGFWIVAMGFMAAMHIGKLPPIVPILRAELGISLVQAGFYCVWYKLRA